MGCVHVEQSCRLRYQGNDYLAEFESNRNTAAITLPDGQVLELPISILRELAFIAARRPGKPCLSSKNNPRSGEKWTAAEDDKLARSFFDGVQFNLIARSHQRSRGAIISRLEKLGHMNLSLIHASHSKAPSHGLANHKLKQ